MGGTSKTTQTQSSTTAPWTEAQPALQGILSQLQGNLSNTGVTGAESGALSTLVSNANNASSTYAPQIADFAKTLLSGGGATDHAGNVNANYQRYVDQTNPLASNTNYNPYDTPGFKDALSTTIADITNATNGQFAAAGRDFSGMNSQTLGRGIMQGVAPTIASQYNQNVQNQQGAAGNLYNAGNTNAGILAGLQQQKLANQGQGVAAAGAATDAANAGANATLQAEAARRGIPVQSLGLLAQIGIPIAGLGSQSSGTATGTKQDSGAMQFGQIAGGLGSLFGGGGGTTVGNIFKMISDRRAKEDITQVGTLFDGTPVYRYRYIGQPAFQIGLMAQDVEKTTPEAVGQIGRFKAVDYKLATDKAVEAA
ncbi:tail fiber domain-containing protein [Bradyrhizobium sp. CSA112]|uniref:tail fiber domain-containing protein n=1 Tax=Bradyrhizobium sp. CSA112 TaxID=2699170 RepID=UPI0023AEC13C|nr:tail fiber domain-containing protein [Bradyrhizobium sp. CSA112]MDE5451334.1 tail fiber domain-containing protein [Bradyrhizobium sp. CSA112]